jgi:signal peptidase
MPTLLKRLWNIVTTVLVAAVVLLAVLLVGVRLVGLTPFVVLSGSMEPTYPPAR